MADLASPDTIPSALDLAARDFAGHLAYLDYSGDGQRTVTWSELSHLAREAAAGLIADGLGRADRVAICCENSIDWIVGYMATTYAGAVGVLVYYDLKPEEIRRQVTWAQCRYLMASRSVLEKLDPGIDGVENVVVLKSEGLQGATALADLSAKATTSSRDELARRGPAANDLAAIIYTSGTTSGAKGVMLTHDNLISNARGAKQAIRFSSKDSTLLVLPLHHAMPFLAAIVLVALVGAPVVIENDLRRIRDRLQEHQPTVFFGVPALFEILYRGILTRAEAEGRLAALRRAQRIVRVVKQLTGLNLGPLIFRPIHKALGGRMRFLMSGGAALNPATARDFFSLGLPLLQGWGMTEASPVVSLQRFSPWRFRFTRYYEQHIGSVGQPIAGVELKLADLPEKGLRVADQGEGEVLVRGPGVFHGYWNAEDQTNEAKRDGWLLTGDLGRIEKDGSIYLTGRSKYIIVLDSGEKVHPEELEEKLSQSDLIEDVCIVGRQQRGRTQVTAVLYPNIEETARRCAADGLPVTEPALRDLVTQDVARICKEAAAYKRVGLIEFSDQPLPKTALRKVARGQISEDYQFSFSRWLESAETPDGAP